MKYFIITIDTEGDNLWEYRLGNPITTENSRYLPRFQKLCNDYGYKPVYLVNYEMTGDNFFVNFASRELINKNCEIGLHLHAWNSPPYYELTAGNNNYGLPYLIEYPETIMNEKINFLLNHLKDKFNTDIISHRSGRWATNQTYFNILIDNGIKIDCSVTPHVSWKNSIGYLPGNKGSDYTDSQENPFLIKHLKTNGTILEIPVTIRMLHRMSLNKAFHPQILFSHLKNFYMGKPVWLRPTGTNLSDMLALIKNIQTSNDNYLMFMIHSSELMPGGSPSFKTNESIEKLYKNLKTIFDVISRHFTGITLKDYIITGPQYELSYTHCCK
jgi:hypothetical protein